MSKLVKEAREAIERKDFESARDSCLRILDNDPAANIAYKASVFLGLAEQNLGHYDQDELIPLFDPTAHKFITYLISFLDVFMMSNTI